MMTVIKALAAGAVGAATTTGAHQVVRGLTPDAPRVDFLGMQALTRLLRGMGIQAPTGSTLYRVTLAADLVSNSAYFALVGAAPRSSRGAVGTALGVAAGLGAVYLPPMLDLSTQPTNRTAATRALTVALYTAGGAAAGLTYSALGD